MKLIGYVTSGYPSVEASFELAEEYRRGCDMLEISLPLLDNTEAPYLADLMVQAYTACPDYACHLDAIARFTARHPSCPVTLPALSAGCAAHRRGEACRLLRSKRDLRRQLPTI